MIVLLGKKSALKKCFIATIGAVLSLAAIFFAVRAIHDNIAKAITQDGETVTVSYTKSIPYDNWSTNDFKVTAASGVFTAFCAEPGKGTPSGNYRATLLSDNAEKNQLIKLMAYIYTIHNNTTNALMDEFFGSLTSNDDILYAYTHAAIGYIYSDDTTGLNSNTLAAIQTVKTSLQSMINNNEDVWLMAKNYKLFKTDVSSSTSLQAVVWIEDANIYGNIAVQKLDNETNSATPQGNGSLQGITFSVYNASGSRIYNPKNGNFYNDGALVATATTNENGAVTFSNLLANVQYQVKETATNSSYLITATPQNTTILTSGVTNRLQFKDEIVRGDVKFTKIDKDSSEPMANVVFEIKSTTTDETHLVISDENGVVDTSASHALHSFHTNGYDDMEKDGLTYLGYGTWFGAIASINDEKGALPYDTYTITELECDANKFCYNTGLEPQTFTIDTNAVVLELENWENDCADFSLETTAVDGEDGDKFIEVDKKAIIKDTVSYCAKPGMEYTIKGILMDKSTGEALSVSGKTIESEATTNATKACDTVEMDFEVDTTELKGKELVVFEKMYYKEELVASHEDINDEGQTINIISLSTTATDNADGDKLLAVNQDVKIKDTVEYCLKENVEFTIKGVLMDKITKQPVLVNGEKVEQTIKVTPEKTCGSAEMFYNLNTTNLGGLDLVVFEYVYHDNELILSHADFNDKDQTISIAPVPPETGHITSSSSPSSQNGNDLIIPVIVGVVGGYIVIRIVSRRKFLYRK